MFTSLTTYEYKRFSFIYNIPSNLSCIVAFHIRYSTPTPGVLGEYQNPFNWKCLTVCVLTMFWYVIHQTHNRFNFDWADHSNYIIWICTYYRGLLHICRSVQHNDLWVHLRHPFNKWHWCIWFFLVVHVVETFLFKPRLFWLLPTTAMCGVGEIIGWSARLWSSKNPFNQNAYTIQYVELLLASYGFVSNVKM